MQASALHIVRIYVLQAAHKRRSGAGPHGAWEVESRTMPHNVNITSATVRTVSTCKEPKFRMKRKVCNIAAATHHIQLSLDERRELYLHNELYDEHNLPVVMGREGSAASLSCECHGWRR